MKSIIWNLINNLPDITSIKTYFKTINFLRISLLNQMGWSIGKNVKIHRKLKFNKNIKIEIGDNSILYENLIIKKSEEGKKDAKFKLGKNSQIYKNCIFDCTNDIEIGNFVHIGGDSLFYTHKHEYKNKKIPLLKQAYTHKKIKLGNNIMSYEQVVYLPGITVEDGCIIAIKSIITKKIPKNSIVAGIPGKIIKKR